MTQASSDSGPSSPNTLGRRVTYLPILLGRGQKFEAALIASGVFVTTKTRNVAVTPDFALRDCVRAATRQHGFPSEAAPSKTLSPAVG